MSNGTRWVGLDVHAQRTAVAVVDDSTGEATKKTIYGRPHDVLPFLAGLEGPVRAVYEAGPTGYGLARSGRDRGIDVQVCAPGLIPAGGPGSRIKTDARDAMKLARLLAAGQLPMVTVPTVPQENVRDLIRAREDARGDLMRARHRISKLLLRREIYWAGPQGAWTMAHRDWLNTLRFSDPASEATFQDYLHGYDTLLNRRSELDKTIERVAMDCVFTDQVVALRCMRGIATLSALGLCAEIRDFRRFEKPTQLSAFLGIVPSENTTGDKRRLGSITRAGSVHARRLLVEAAWHYRKPPRMSSTLRQRQQDAPPAAVDCAWRAQRRLYQRWQRLETERGKRPAIVAIAVARELSHFCWETAQTT